MGATLCYVGGEVLAYRDAALTSANHYTLSYLRRGQKSTAIAAHASGDTFIRLDDALFRYAHQSADIGRTVYIKLQSFNSYGRALQDLSTLTPITYTVSPVLALPDNLAAATSAINGASSISINASYTGAITALPRTQAYQMLLQGVDVTTKAAWSVSVLSGAMSASIGASTGILSLNTSGGSSPRAACGSRRYMAARRARSMSWSTSRLPPRHRLAAAAVGRRQARSMAPRAARQ
jgi:hypothetical protein